MSIGCVESRLGGLGLMSKHNNRFGELAGNFSCRRSRESRLSFNTSLNVVTLNLRLLEAIEHGRGVAFCYFLLGKLYWEMNGNLRADKSKCLAQFLKVRFLSNLNCTCLCFMFGPSSQISYVPLLYISVKILYCNSY